MVVEKALCRWKNGDLKVGLETEMRTAEGFFRAAVGARLPEGPRGGSGSASRWLRDPRTRPRTSSGPGLQIRTLPE